LENIIIPDKKKLEHKAEKIKKEGADKLHFLSDFDRTLTYGTIGREKVPSLISILREKNYLDEDYSKRAKELFARYHPYEIDTNLSREEKVRKMDDWWRTHKKLLIEKGIRRDHLEKLVKDESIRFRDSVQFFLERISEKNIPFIVFSASGCGEAVEMFFEEMGVKYPNIYFLVNRFKWDNEGKAIGFKEPFIHPFSKNERTVKEMPSLYEKVKERKNVVLFGDSLSDVEMIEGFDHDTLLKVGFLNTDYNGKDREKYEEVYDIVLTGDTDISALYENLLEEII